MDKRTETRLRNAIRKDYKKWVKDGHPHRLCQPTIDGPPYIADFYFFGPVDLEHYCSLLEPEVRAEAYRELCRAGRWPLGAHGVRRGLKDGHNPFEEEGKSAHTSASAAAAAPRQFRDMLEGHGLADSADGPEATAEAPDDGRGKAPMSKKPRCTICGNDGPIAELFVEDQDAKWPLFAGCEAKVKEILRSLRPPRLRTRAIQEPLATSARGQRT